MFGNVRCSIAERGSREGQSLGKTRTVLQALLHAAALDCHTPAELFSWTLSPATAADAVAILANHPDAAGWAESVDSMIQSDPRTRDSIWMGVSLALAGLADPRVLDAVTPPGPARRQHQVGVRHTSAGRVVEPF